MIFKERPSRDKGVIVANRLQELHLYPGNACNRSCDFCTVFGSPQGDGLDYSPELLDQALQSVILDEQGTIKFYGGEPTLRAENLLWAIGYLRQQGFRGAIVIYSNGILAEPLLQILAADPLHQTTASLNYSIATGDGAPQMPSRSLALLEAYEQANPSAIAIGHPAIVDSGRGVEPFTGTETRPQDSSRCPHCYPVLTAKGQVHACPFAVENQSPHFQLGDRTSDPATVAHNFQAFFNWLDQQHEPYAIAHSLPACTVCWQHLDELPLPEFQPSLEPFEA